MTTYLQLRTKVERVLRDESLLTFDVQDVKDMVSAAWAEIGRVAPQLFQEDITPVDGQTAYVLRSDDFDAIPQPEIEVVTVEIWDGSVTPARALKMIPFGGGNPSGLSYSQVGWKFWGGTLYLPDRWADIIDASKHIIRVWGYSPYPLPSGDSDVLPISAALEEATVLLCQIEALRRLIGSRILFKQWQTHSNNTDVSMAQLASEKNIADDEWRRRSRALTVLREAPG